VLLFAAFFVDRAAQECKSTHLEACCDHTVHRVSTAAATANDFDARVCYAVHE
jgi:hypothetical protein